MSDNVRPIHEIAREIRRVWPNPYFAAAPYLDAMRDLTTVKDKYLFDDGEGIVRRFLGNAKTWRGDDARRLKAELQAHLK